VVEHATDGAAVPQAAERQGTEPSAQDTDTKSCAQQHRTDTHGPDKPQRDNETAQLDKRARGKLHWHADHVNAWSRRTPVPPSHPAFIFFGLPSRFGAQPPTQPPPSIWVEQHRQSHVPRKKQTPGPRPHAFTWSVSQSASHTDCAPNRSGGGRDFMLRAGSGVAPLAAPASAAPATKPQPKVVSRGSQALHGASGLASGARDTQIGRSHGARSELPMPGDDTGGRAWPRCCMVAKHACASWLLTSHMSEYVRGQGRGGWLTTHKSGLASGRWKAFCVCRGARNTPPK